MPVAGGIQLQLGDAYAEERRRVLFELGIPRLASLGVAKAADVVVRYVSVGEEVAAHELTLPIVVNMVSAEEAKTAGSDREVVDEVLILKAARAQDEARRLADEGDFDQARSLLRTTAEEKRTVTPGSTKAAELLAEAEGLESSAFRTSPDSYKLDARKRMSYENRTRRQRRTRPSDGSGPRGRSSE